MALTASAAAYFARLPVASSFIYYHFYGICLAIFIGNLLGMCIVTLFFYLLPYFGICLAISIEKF